MSVIRVGLTGLVLNISLKENGVALDLSDAESITISVQGPTGTTISDISPTVVSPDSSGNLTTTLTSIFTEPGYYSFSPSVLFVDGSLIPCDPFGFRVYGLHEVIS